MREIKFRAWDIDKKEMFYSDFIVYANGRIGWWVSEVGYEEMILVEKKVEIMQYTGLKDKNGKEIYEGDVFMDEEDGHCNFVEWSTHYSGWVTNEWFSPKELTEQSKDLEIIGNIYENPELLNPHTT